MHHSSESPSHPSSLQTMTDAAGLRFYPVEDIADMGVDGILDAAQQVIEYGVSRVVTGASNQGSSSATNGRGRWTSGTPQISNINTNSTNSNANNHRDSHPVYHESPTALLLQHRVRKAGNTYLFENNQSIGHYNGNSYLGPSPYFHPNSAGNMNGFSAGLTNNTTEYNNHAAPGNIMGDKSGHHYHQVCDGYNSAHSNQQMFFNGYMNNNHNAVMPAIAHPNSNVGTSAPSGFDGSDRPIKRSRTEDFASNGPTELSSPSYALSEYVAPMRQQRDADLSEFRFRAYQSDAWTERLDDLRAFREKHGHCLVPHNYSDSIPLAQWVKRQRYQYKLKMEGRHSTMSDDRLQILDGLGFVWDSHRAAWEERFNELVEFKNNNNHSNVPSSYTQNPQLSVWTKCQRRQYKLLRNGKKSNMTEERVHKLNNLGFIWNPRKLSDGSD